MKSASLLLLDNNSLLDILHSGNFRVEEISFEEAKAIVDMYDTKQIKRCFQSSEISDLLYKHLGIAAAQFNYQEADEVLVEQDAIAFRTYVTPSETQPSILTDYGNEATKIQNIYIYCQYLTKVDPALWTPREGEA
ncbi:MAG: hypothetical protein RR573_08275 [Oscillospiraceae bacterium]